MVTLPHWAEGSVAVIGLPAGGSWRRGAGRWDPSLCGVAPVCLIAAFVGFLPRRGASRRTPRPLWVTAVAVPFAVSVCFFPLNTTD